MKPYNEKEYNKLCAEFLEWEMSDDDFGVRYWKESPDGVSNWYLDEMQFHENWNWIMEVVEKIKKVIGNPTTVTVACFNGDINKALMSAKKEAVVQSIWEFLNWYNEQKQ